MKDRKLREAGKAKQAKKLVGNQNARTSVHGSRVIRISGYDTDLLYDFFASEGNFDPSSDNFNHAIHYALGRVYGRKLENDQANIL